MTIVNDTELEEQHAGSPAAAVEEQSAPTDPAQSADAGIDIDDDVDADAEVDAELDEGIDAPQRDDVADAMAALRAAERAERGELGPELLQRIVEGALLAAGKPLAVDDLMALFDLHERPTIDAIRAALAAIAAQCEGRGFQLREVASGFRFQVIQEVAPWIARLWEEKPQRYSRALLETLALIAYRQPITRGDIEDIRGVAVASNIIKTLLERDWVRVVGHKDVPGRPAMYATTRRFLDYFNLQNLDDLPTLAEIRDLDSMNAELALEGIDTVPIDEQALAADNDALSEDEANADGDAENEAGVGTVVTAESEHAGDDLLIADTAIDVAVPPGDAISSIEEQGDGQQENEERTEAAEHSAVDETSPADGEVAPSADGETDHPADETDSEHPGSDTRL